MECDYHDGLIENGYICKNLTKNGESQRNSWEREEGEEEEF